jgi:hypothetical protein
MKGGIALRVHLLKTNESRNFRKEEEERTFCFSDEKKHSYKGGIAFLAQLLLRGPVAAIART